MLQQLDLDEDTGRIQGKANYGQGCGFELRLVLGPFVLAGGVGLGFLRAVSWALNLAPYLPYWVLKYGHARGPV